MPSSPPLVREPAVREPAVRTLGGRPRPRDESARDPDAREANARDESGPGARPAEADRTGPRSTRGADAAGTNGRLGSKEPLTEPDAEPDAEPAAEPDAAADPWEALALAAVRTAVRAVRAADDGWAARLTRVAADPGVRGALHEVADAARRIAGSSPTVADRPSPAAPAVAPPAPGSPIGATPAEAARGLPQKTEAPPAPAASLPVASLGEIRDRLTLGAAPPAPAAGTAATGLIAAENEELSTLRSEDVRGLARAPDRCRSKAAALRWAADRLVAGAETGPLRTRRETIEAAADPGEALWPLFEPAPPAAAPADYTRAAAIFEVLAEAAALLDTTLDRFLGAAPVPPEIDGGASAKEAVTGEELDHLKAALDLTAEAQSMTLIAVRALREKPDRDQVAIYKTIRDISDARTGIAYFIRSYLREGSHADPSDHADLASRIGGAAVARSRGKAEREAFKKFAHAAGKAAEHADDSEPTRFEYHAARAAKFAARLLALGVPPSDVRFRETVPEDPAPLRAAVQRLADAAGSELEGSDAPAANDPAANDPAAALARVLDALPRPAADEADDDGDAPAARYADSVDAAVARAAEEYPQALAFVLNSKSVREGYPYRHPDRVYLGLKFLATTLRDALAGRAACPDLDEECLRQCGLRYSPNQSSTTMGQFPEDYRTVWGGEEVPLTRHLGAGNNKDPRLSIRLAFYYDRAADTVVVGYLGQHQRTRAT